MYWRDIGNEAYKIMGDVEFRNAPGFNSSSDKVRSQRRRQSLAQFVHQLWNSPKAHNSPHMCFGGVLYPTGLDDDGNVVYKINKELAGQ